MASVSGGLFGAGLASAGGAGTRIGAAFVEVFANTGPLQSGLAQAEARFGKFGANLNRASAAASRTGSFLTRNLTVPLVAAGGVAVKMAADFEFAMARTANLAGVPIAKLDSMRESVLALSHETAQAPEELADALYIVASAGLKASQVLPVLEYSAKAAGAGMSDAATVAHLLSGVMVAYGHQAPTAAQAMDVLTAAIREGKAEPDELASNLGTVVPVAAGLSVEFDELAGYVAALTNENVGAARAATGLRYLLIQMQNPSEQAKDQIEDVGLSMQQLQDVAGEQGLAASLQLLADRFDLTSAKGREAFYEVVGGVRAGHIAMGLIGESAGNVNRILEETAKAGGNFATEFDTAFGAQTQTSLFQFQQAWNDLKIAAIEAGTVLMPIAKNIVQTIANMAQSFSKLSDASQSNIVKWGLIAAAAGPVIRTFGAIGGAISTLIGWYRALATASTAAATAQTAATLAPVAKGATAASAAPGMNATLQALANAGGAATGTSALTTKLLGLGAALAKTSLVAGGTVLAIGFIDNAMEMANYSVRDMALSSGLAQEAVQSMEDAFESGAAELNPFRSKEDAVVEMTERFNTVLNEAVEAGMSETDALEKMYEALGTANAQVGGITGSFDKFEGVLRQAVGVGVPAQLEQFRDTLGQINEDAVAARGSLGSLAPAFAEIGTEAVAPQIDMGALTEALRGPDIKNMIEGTTSFTLDERPLTAYAERVLAVADAVNTYLAEGGRMGAMVRDLTNFARQGGITWEDYGRILGEVGAKIPFSDLGRFGTAINQASDATQGQRVQLASALRTINAFKVGVNNARAASALAAAENGNLGASYKILAGSIEREVLGKLRQVRGELSKAQIAKIKAEVEIDPIAAINHLNQMLGRAKLPTMKIKPEVEPADIESIRHQASAGLERAAATVDIKAELEAGGVKNAIGALTNPRKTTITAQAETGKADSELDAVAKQNRTASIDATIGSNAWTSYQPPDKTAYINVVTRGELHSGGIVAHQGRMIRGAGREVDVRALAGEMVVNRRATRRSMQLLQAINAGRIDDRTLVGGGGGRRGVGISSGNVVNVNLHIDGYQGDAHDLARKVGLELSRVASRHQGGFALSG